MIKKGKLILGAAIAIILLLLLYSQIDVEKLSYLTEIQLDIEKVGLAFFLFIIVNFIRTLRFKFIFNHKFKLGDLFVLSTYHTLYMALFPGGIGDLSFILLVKKKMKENIPSAFSVLLITRIYDLLILAISFLLAILFLGILDINIQLILPILGIIALMVFFIQNLHKIVVRIKNGIRYFIKNPRRLKKMSDTLGEIGNVLEENKKRVGVLFYFSILLWSLNFLVFKVYFLSFGFKLNYFEAIMMGTISNLTAVIPLNTIGGFGYKETGVTLGLLLTGMAKNNAIVLSFLVHLLSIFFVVLLSAVGFLFSMKLKSKKGTALL